MANNWNLPDNSSLYSDVLTLLRAELASLAKMSFSGDSNIPSNSIDWDNTNKNLRRESGGTFSSVGGPVPAGGMIMWGAAAAPTGWLLCDGTAVSRTTYADIFSAIGTTYGVGNGSTTFNLPDLRQRFPLGKAASGTGSTLGGTGGSIDHTHTVPAHYHGMGTGATLNITSSGSHSHTIDHDHGSVTSGATSPGTNSNGDHTHFVVAEDLSSTTLSGSNQLARTYDGAGGVYAYDLKGSGVGCDRGKTSTNGSHSHTVDSHTHSVDLPNFTGSSGAASHTHTAGNFSGVIGLVTGGVDGNASMTSGTGNPPYLVVNYIIKI